MKAEVKVSFIFLPPPQFVHSPSPLYRFAAIYCLFVSAIILHLQRLVVQLQKRRKDFHLNKRYQDLGRRQRPFLHL